MADKYSALKILDDIKEAARQHAILRHHIRLLEDTGPYAEGEDQKKAIQASAEKAIQLLKQMNKKLKNFGKTM